MLKNKKTIFALSLIPQYGLVRLLSNFPEFIETYYSNGLYLFISKLLRYTLGWLPFSFGDIVYFLGIVYILRWLYINRKRLRKDTKNWVIDSTAAVSVIYFAFHFFWGINYYRIPLHDSLKLDHKYTTEELVRVTKKLISVSNKLHRDITKNDSVKIVFPFDKNAVIAHIPEGYKNLKKVFPKLHYAPKSVKKSLFSFPLTYMGFSGYLNPLTNEAQVNTKIPLFKLPTTTAHEIAHELGYAAENEANFIGFLAATHHDDIFFKYCGYTFGLRFCLNEIYRRDECLFEDIIADVNKGILKDYEEGREFWRAHENPLEPVFKVLYDNFLKANNQSKGMESYSYVVALLVNYLDDKL